MTADRVRRFAAMIEDDPSTENRRLWREAMGDLRRGIRAARAAGAPASIIHDATDELPTGRFLRDPAAGDRERRPQLSR